jgi:hypothetical protein
MDLILTICLAVLAFATGLVQYLFNRYNKGKAEKDKKDSSLSLIIIGILVLFIACWKGVREDNAKGNINASRESLQNTLGRLDSTSDLLEKKMVVIDTLTNYIKRIDILGIKRDTVTNMPIITTTFNSNIKSQTNVNSINQKGGQTARDIINN